MQLFQNYSLQAEKKNHNSAFFYQKVIGILHALQLGEPYAGIFWCSCCLNTCDS